MTVRYNSLADISRKFDVTKRSAAYEVTPSFSNGKKSSILTCLKIINIKCVIVNYGRFEFIHKLLSCYVSSLTSSRRHQLLPKSLLCLLFSLLGL